MGNIIISLEVKDCQAKMEQSITQATGADLCLAIANLEMTKTRLLTLLEQQTLEFKASGEKKDED